MGYLPTARSERRNKVVMAAQSTSPCPQPLDLAPRSPDVAMALNSCPNLPLTQGAGPERAVFRRVDWLGKGAVNRSLEAKVPRSSPRRPDDGSIPRLRVR